MKKWKIFLICLFVILVGAGSYLYYILEMKEYDTADTQVDEITDKKFEVILPDDSEENTHTSTPKEKITNDDTVTQIDTDTITEKPSTTKTEKSNNADETLNKDGKKENNTVSNNKSEGTATNTKNKDETVASQITAKYEPSFKDLEAQANSRVDKLVSLAIAEYQAKRKNNEAISYPYFYAKYTSAGRTLESNADTAFEIVYNEYTNELKKNGLESSYAEKIRSHYEATKKERRNNLLKRAAKYAK